MTVSQLYKETCNSLFPALGESEARSAARLIFEDVRGMSQTDIVLYGHRELEDFTVENIRAVVKKIADGEPVQYAVGLAKFYGMDFKVTPDVLIPRPETEGLVDMIVDLFKGQEDLRILDSGTGSGCIAIALARSLPFAQVDAIDISAKAIDVARLNAQTLKVKVNFKLGDILNLQAEKPVYDIIVSNPPYITESERAQMDSRVYDYEPSTALFVPDDDPIKFYRAIAEYGAKALMPGGMLYFEINQSYGPEIVDCLKSMGYGSAEVYRDYIGRNRYVVAQWPH